MPDVALHLILIVHLIQNQLVFIKKAKNAGIVECRLESYRIVRVFDCA